MNKSFTEIEKLKQSEERYRTIITEMEDGFFEIDLNGRFTFVNQAECRNLGYPRREVIGMSFKKYTCEEDFRELISMFTEIYNTGKSLKSHDLKIIRKDGGKAFHEISAYPVKDVTGETIGFRGIARDVTDRKRMEEKLRYSEERYRSIIEEMEDGYFETDLNGRLTYVNEAECRNLGYSSRELIGMTRQQYVEKEICNDLDRIFVNVYKTGRAVKAYDVEVIKKNGEKAFNEISVTLMRNSAGEPVGFRGIARDVTERKRIEDQIRHLATHDALTGLPNRMLFMQLLDHSVKFALRYKRHFALFFLDLDRFKIVNDTLGHSAGDQLLQETGARLKKVLRSADVIARMGGDEFVALVAEMESMEQIASVGHKIVAAIGEPVRLAGEECRITASVGISIFPKDAQEGPDLLKKADMAMYLAKEKGKNNYQFHSGADRSKSDRMSMEAHLRNALERRELYLEYQAKLDFGTGMISGVEALLRWQNPHLGAVSPNRLIPVAEETGLIIPIGKWVLKTACMQCASWQRQGLAPVCMSVNLSLRQLTNEFLVEDIQEALEISGISPSQLEIEITESMVMQDPARMIPVLHRIKELGVRLAIDDFGTGYSTLARIANFPLDTIKVDRSFIRNIPKSRENSAVTRAIIAIGKSLSLTIVAEGVETIEQLNFLQDLTCDQMQGFYLSKPVSPEKFADLLRSHNPSSYNK